MENKKRLSILILSWRGPGHPHAGGAEVSTHEHTKGWIKAGHSVTLFTSSYPEARAKEIVDGVNIIRLGSQIFGVHLEAFKWYLFGNHPKYDLVIDQFHGIPFFTPLFVRAKKLAFIHEVTKEVWALNPWPKPYNLIPTILGKIFEPLIFRLLYRHIPFMTVSDSTKKDLISWGIPNQNITVIHNGVTRSVTKTSPDKEKKKTIIFLGALSMDKGVEDALAVFSKLASKDHFQFWIVGKSDPRYLKELKIKTKVSKISGQVKFWGYVSEEKKFELLARAHILVNPSIREGWGLVVLEAAVVGTPTVGYDVPGLRDSIIDGKTGILSAPYPKDCARQVLFLISSKEKLKKFGVNCINWSKKFSWEKSTSKSLKLIENLIANKYFNY